MIDQLSVAPKQLALLMFASLLTDAFIQPFGRQSSVPSAQMGILSAAIQMVGFAVVFWLFMKKFNNVLETKWGCGALAAVLLLSATLEIIQGERFYSYVMDADLPVASFLVIMFFAVFYGVYSGMDALSRTAAIILALTGISIGFLLISILPQLRFVNLQPAALKVAPLLDSLKQQIYFPPELFVWAYLLKQSDQKKKNNRSQLVFCWLFTASSLFYLLGEMTLGRAYQNQEQPLFTIARLGGISVFRRLDALHVSVWLLLFLIKITLYFSMIAMLLKKIWPALEKHVPYYLAAAGALVLFLLTWSQVENTAYMVQQGMLLFLGIIMLLPIHKKETFK